MFLDLVVYLLQTDILIHCDVKEYQTYQLLHFILLKGLPTKVQPAFI